MEDDLVKQHKNKTKKINSTEKQPHQLQEEFKDTVIIQTNSISKNSRVIIIFVFFCFFCFSSLI